MDENGETTRPLRVQVVHGNCLWRDCLAQVLARDQELQVTAVDPGPVGLPVARRAEPAQR